MNITSLEIAQATMDMFFCLFCLIIFVSIKANNPKQKSMRMFVRLFLIATVLFFGETLAYIFRGNLDLFNILVTRIANLMVFAMNIAMANTYVRFVSSVFVEKGAEVSGNSVKIADIFSCINIFIVVVNLFYPWMYYFDEANYYHRNNFWYVYTLILLVVIFIGAGMTIKYRKYLEKRKQLHFNDAVFVYSNNCNSCTVLYLWIFYNQFRTGNRFSRNVCCIYV